MLNGRAWLDGAVCVDVTQWRYAPSQCGQHATRTDGDNATAWRCPSSSSSAHMAHAPGASMPSSGEPTPLRIDRALLARSCPPGAELGCAGNPPSVKLLSCAAMCRVATRAAAMPGRKRSIVESALRRRLCAAVATVWTAEGADDRSWIRADTNTSSCSRVFGACVQHGGRRVLWVHGARVHMPLV